MDIQSLVGFLLPPVIDFINNRVADTRIRYLLSLVLCIVVGLIVNYQLLTGEWTDVSRLLANIGVVFATAQTTYALYWKSSDKRVKLNEFMNKER